MNFIKFIKKNGIFILIIIVAFVIRFSFVSSMDFYHDEVTYETRLLVYDGISPWLTSAAVQPPLFPWISSIFVRFLGFNEFSIRISSVLFGIFTIILIYYLVKLWYGPKHALLSAFLLAIIPTHVLYSRMAFREIIQIFFLLSAIFIMELIENKKIRLNFRYVWLSFAGVLFALSFLTKYNAIVIWALYCIFLVGYSLIKQRKIENAAKTIFKDVVIVNLIALIFVFLVIAITAGVPHLVHVIYGIIDWSIAQTVTYTPYYYFLILFDGLSPFLYLTFIVALIYLMVLIYKKRIRTDILLIFLFFTYFLIINIQPRKYFNYLQLIIPFIVIIISRFLLSIYKKNKYLAFYLGLFLLFSTAGWTMYEITKYNNYNVWSDLGGYINKNFPEDTTVYAYDFSLLALNYIERNLNFSDDVLQLKKGDLVILNWLSPDNIIRWIDPMGKSILETKRLPPLYTHTNYYNSIVYPLIKQDKLLRVFGDGKVNSTWLFQITEPKIIEINPQEKGRDHLSRHPKMWGFICNYLNKKTVVKQIIFRFMSTRQIKVIQGRCE